MRVKLSFEAKVLPILVRDSLHSIVAWALTNLPMYNDGLTLTYLSRAIATVMRTDPVMAIVWNG